LLLWLVALTVAPANHAGAGDGGGSPDELKSLMGMSLDQLLDVRVDKVYGASKYEQNISQAPASVTIVTSDEIKKQGYRTLAEILRSVRGLFITDDRAYSYLGIRGFGRPSDYNSRVLVLVDGHRMNDNIYDSVLIGTEGVVDVDLIERVEVIRGPSSSIYGDNAFFGVINIITRPGNSYGGVEVSGEVGGFESYKGRFSYGNRFTNGVELVLSGTWYQSAGERRLYYREFDAPTSNNGIAEDSDGDRYYRFFGKLSYEDFTLSGAWSERTKTIPTASYSTIFNDGGEGVVDRYAYADLKYEHTFASDVTVLGKVYYDNYKYTGEFPYNVAPPTSPIVRVLNRDIAYGEWAGVNWQLTAPVGERVKVVVGSDFRGDLRQHQANYDVNPRAVYLDDDTASWNAGVYAQGEFAICTNLLFSGGVRLDYYDTFGRTINPRLSLIYSPWPKTNFKLLYGQAYRAPNVYELYYGSLEPETIHTYEVVYEQDLPAHLRFVASGYYYQVDELISETLSGFQNLGRVNAEGMELELEGHYPRGLTARVSYALQRAEDHSTGLELSNSPRHLAKGSLIAPLYKDKIFAGFELQYTGSVLTNTRRREDDYLLANVTLFSQNLAPGLEVSASIYNLFDAHYAHPVSAAHTQDAIEQPGRSFRVKLTYKF
jgi:iron complex outermembrane receptor protein